MYISTTKVQFLRYVFFSMIFTAGVSASDFVVPSGIVVLTEQQLMTRVIGSSFVSKNKWVEYHVPSDDGVKEGKLKGWDSTLGLYFGKWRVNGSVMCTEYDRSELAIYNNCVTTVIDGDNVSWYLIDGNPSPSNVYQVSLVPGNPKGL